MSVTQEGRLLKLTTPLAADFLLIKRFRASEALSRLFTIDAEILHDEESEGSAATVVDPTQLLGQAMTIEVDQLGEIKRYFNGICVEFTQGNRHTRYSHYRAKLVPRVWLLTQNSQSRIFQNQSVPDILQKVFEGLDYSLEVQGTFEPRNYCVQYRESDFDFASRLMEEEGIYYYFAHTDNSHTMILANTPSSHKDCPTKADIPFTLDYTANTEWVGQVYTWVSATKLRTGKVTLRDHQFQLPHNDLESSQTSAFNFGANQKFELYDYPGEYAKRFDGIASGGGDQASQLQKVFEDRERTVKIRQGEIDVDYKTSYGTSDCCSLTAGYRFRLSEHSLHENNRNHVLVNVQIEAVQSPSYHTENLVSNGYVVNFVTIPQGDGSVPFHPLRSTEKPIVHGCQTAFVVGPAGEEIFTDKYGRVKVQFHWDRQGTNDSASSCWLRVATTSAGNQWGAIFVPRIGQEVIVDFLEGDPDQPIIVGGVYNAENMPPYTLPDEKTKSTIKTNSSKGGGGFNELRFEDKKGSEQIFIHAEKNEDILVKADCTESIGNDRHLTVTSKQFEKVGSDKSLTVVGDLTEKINGSVGQTIGGAQQIKISQKFAVDAGTEIHLKSGMTTVIEAGASLTLKVGGNFININPAGVSIVGTMVMINSGGAAGSGSGASPASPTAPNAADNANPGQVTKISPASPPAQPAMFAALASLVRGSAGAAGGAAGAAAGAAGAAAQAAAAQAAGAAQGAGAAVAAQVAQVAQAASEAKDQAESAAQQLASDLMANAQAYAAEVEQRAQDAKDAVQSVENQAQQAADDAKQAVADAQQQAQAAMQQAQDAAQQAQQQAQQAAQQVQQAGQQAEQQAQQAAQQAQQQAQQAMQQAQQQAQQAAQQAQQAAQQVQQQAQEAAQQAQQAATQAADQAQQAAQQVSDAAGQALQSAQNAIPFM